MTRLITFFLIAAILTGCDGSGGGISGTGVRNGSDIVVGTIDGFGSIIVNQLRLETDNADIRVNGTSSTQDALSVGMLVTVKADIESRNVTQVDYVPMVVGPVRSIDANANTLDILGHTIRTSTTTRYEGIVRESITTGTVLEVSGFVSADREIIATFIRATASAVQYQLIANVNSVSQGFDISIDLSDIEFALAQLELELQLLNELDEFDFFSTRRAVLTLPAKSNSANLSLAFILPTEDYIPGSKAEVTQAVTSNGDVGIFTTDDFVVTTTANTRITFDSGAPAALTDIQLNRLVRVSGILPDNTATILADRIVIVSDQ